MKAQKKRENALLSEEALTDFTLHQKKQGSSEMTTVDDDKAGMKGCPDGGRKSNESSDIKRGPGKASASVGRRVCLDVTLLCATSAP
jgi:hypothetical protein